MCQYHYPVWIERLRTRIGLTQVEWSGEVEASHRIFNHWLHQWITGNTLIRTRWYLTFLLAGLFTIMSCSDDSVSPGPDNSEQIYNDDGGFVITHGMLNKRYNEITFPATHNSHTYHGFWAELCLGGTKNQGMSIVSQLDNGIRYIEFDINCYFNLCHGGIHSPHALYDELVAIRDYVETHPKQIITVRISDVNRDPCIWVSPHEIYTGVNDRLRNSGLAEYVYNFDILRPDDDLETCYIPDQWPKLRDMIESGKNVMFFHNRDFHEFGVFDEGLCPGLKYSDANLYWYYAAINQEQLCRLMPTWDPPRDRQIDGANRLFFLESMPENCDAGERESASKNNDGRRLYQLSKQWEDEVLPGNRVVNFISVDFFRSSPVGRLPIDIIDVCNRLHYERFGFDWEKSACFWELYPYEFDDSQVEHLSQIPAIRAEVEAAVNDHYNRINLDGHEDRGDIVSTTYYTIHNSRTLVTYDWKCIPEWAVDADLFTRWCGSSSRPNHTWGIDLGAQKSINEIAIAWEFSYKAPAYTVYVSNDDARFAEYISNDELLNDSGWIPVVVQSSERPSIVPAELWDRRAIDLDSIDLVGARYIKIKVTDADSEYWPSFWEVRIYGPASSH